MKEKFVDYFMKLADSTSELSSARRLKVGSVLVRDGQVLSTGYNGTPTGWDNDCETIELMPVDLDPSLQKDYPMIGTFWIDGQSMERFYRLKTKPEVIHAESNCISKIARSHESSIDATMFCTHEPCLDCAKLIYQSGIKKLWYREEYRDHRGLDFLHRGGIEVARYFRK